MAMRLGYIANSPLAYNGTHYFYQSGEWLYLERLAALVDTVDVCAPITEMSMEHSELRKHFSRQLTVKNIRVFNLSPVARYEKALGWFGRRLAAFRTLRQLSVWWDFAFIMAPSWSALEAWFLSRNQRWNYAVYFRGDWVERARYRLPETVRHRLFLQPYLQLIQKLEAVLMHDAVLRMTEGQVLFNRYRELQTDILSSITLQLNLDQFRPRCDTCTGPTVRLITVGSLVEGKGMDITLRAAKQLSLKHAIELHIVGTGGLQTELAELADALQLTDQVYFHGQIPGGQCVLNLMYECDIFVLTSYSEGFPRVIYEAFSQCLPVVVTAVGGIPRTLTNEQNALLVQPGNPSAVASAVERIICNGAMRRRMIRSSYQFAYDVIQSDPVGVTLQAFREALKLE